MKQVPIEQLVGAAGGTMTVQKDGSTKFHLSATSLQWLVDYVRSIENEACAMVCEAQGAGRKAMEHYAALTYSGSAHDCAAAIRARSK